MKQICSILILLLVLAGCSNDIPDPQLEPAVEEETSASADEMLDEQETVEEADSLIGMEDTPPVFKMKDGNLHVYGLTLGDSPATAEAIWGTPEVVEEEFSMDGETYFFYPEKDMTVGYFEEKAQFIAVPADEEDLQEIKEGFEGEYYRYPDGDNDFFYSPESGHLLIYGASSSVNGETEIRLLASDDNFFYYVEEGIYEKVEE